MMDGIGLTRWPFRGPLIIRRHKIGSRLELDRIVLETAVKYGVTVDDLKSRSRLRRIAWPRQEAMAHAYDTGRFSLPRIGAYFGLDHTTVLHAVRRVESRRRDRAAAISAALGRALAQQEAA